MQKKVTKIYYYNINNDHRNEKMQEIKMNTIYAFDKPPKDE